MRSLADGAGASGIDIGAATYGIIGVVATLHEGDTTGHGQMITSGLLRPTVLDSPFKRPDTRNDPARCVFRTLHVIVALQVKPELVRGVEEPR